MGLAVALVPALADELAVAHHHGADQRVGLDVAAAALGQLQGALHPDSSVGVVHAVVVSQCSRREVRTCPSYAQVQVLPPLGHRCITRRVGRSLQIRLRVVLRVHLPLLAKGT